MSRAETLLRLWEAGCGCAPVERPLRLLAQTHGEEPADLAGLSLGARDRRLIGLRETLFGREMACVAPCPACGSVNEFALDARALDAMGDRDQPDAPLAAPGPDGPVPLRLLTTADLIAVAGLPPDQMRAGLVARAMDAEPADEATIEAAARLLEAADPLAALSLDLACAGCGQDFEVGLDPAEHLWTELVAAVRRLLAEVHRLAAAYGWSETAILALSPARRAAYLDMVGA
ncbi:hypothetical protein [Caulobacter endophyticus]|uniref:hypothetical protein n=1 Tax=Caulobacter endophyticus TaxID=2172652 RepID=UPI00240FE85F|nr:hypothetical protein [Caulobacter endophyticus]MDG2527878.1 hypothetical protein [Caulobacter endophyticus]